MELPPISINSNDGCIPTIRVFQLTLNDVTVEVSSLGASITKVLLPNYARQTASTPGLGPGQNVMVRDDVVLSYASQQDQYDDENKPFFGAIVGRVANRIKDGRFHLLQKTQSSNKLETYQLEKNNGPNHLHGGSDGFWKKIWSARIVNDSIQFNLISQDGDQGYPGGIEVTAAYSLVHLSNEDDGRCGAKLCLEMHANLLPGETKATPISLAQHSYFNLASHSARRGILDHTLHLPNCTKFTPFDNTSIPTRVVQRVDIVGSTSMDFRKEKIIGYAIERHAEDRAQLGHGDTIRNNIQKALTNAESEAFARILENEGTFGFDHNYVMNDHSLSENESLRPAAILSHPPTGRSLRVSTTAPGMQLYTSNYLDGTSPPSTLTKDGATYFRWQGICLETQTYPDSIFESDDDVVSDDEFSSGRCFILRPGGREYSHVVQYEFLDLCS